MGFRVGQPLVCILALPLTGRVTVDRHLSLYLPDSSSEKCKNVPTPGGLSERTELDELCPATGSDLSGDSGHGPLSASMAVEGLWEGAAPLNPELCSFVTPDSSPREW